MGIPSHPQLTGGVKAHPVLTLRVLSGARKYSPDTKTGFQEEAPRRKSRSRRSWTNELPVTGSNQSQASQNPITVYPALSSGCTCLSKTWMTSRSPAPLYLQTAPFLP